LSGRPSGAPAGGPAAAAIGPEEMTDASEDAMIRPMRDAHRVVVIGAGFAGLTATRSLDGAPVTITVIDRRNFHLFQPLLYQVATAALNPSDIAFPIRSVLRTQANV